MGAGTFSSSDWSSYRTSRGYTSKSTASEMYTRSKIKDEFNPLNFSVRESCDSAEHPNSTPIILGLDVTGSMSGVLTTISNKLNKLILDIYERQPVKDPQIMVIGFGDTECDHYPIQATQFESDIRIAEQLNDIYFEQGGGGNDGESYILPWYFASRRTKIDSYDKHGKKGFLFTMGDEPFLKKITRGDIKKFVGDDIEADLTAEELLSEVSKQYEVYHLLIEEGSYMRFYGDDCARRWRELLGQRAITVSDCDKIPEIIVSILEIAAGKEVDDVIASWDGSTKIAVSSAVGGLSAVSEDNAVIEF